MKRLCSLIVLLLAVGPVSFLKGDEAAKEQVAVTAAEKWLAVVDAGQHAESWKSAAEYFRSAVKQEQWEQAIKAVRPALGKLISRKVKSKTFKTSLPGAPDGEYVILEFESSFENKKAAVETVTPMKDKDGQWRVAGYFIK